MNNTATYFKWGVILVIFLGLLWMRWQCTHKTGGEVVKIKRDTTYIKTRDTVLIDHPVPYKVTYWKEKVLHDTLETIETLLQHVDSARILDQYFAMRDYDTTMKVKYGQMRMRATVMQNRIVAATFNLNQDIPQVKETVTLTQPKRVVLYFGVQAMGNKENLPYAAGATLDLKLKSDGIIGVGGYLTKDQPMFSFGMKFPIKLRKH